MRLLTRSDFDGLACGAMLKELGIIKSWGFVHPMDIQDGLIQLEENDVLVNMPYVPGCKLWFNHHANEGALRESGGHVLGMSRVADSAARVVYEYYGGKEHLARFEEMVAAVDKMHVGRLSEEEILNPRDWELLGFIMDPRTGLGRFQDFRISNYDLMEELMDACRTQGIAELLDNLDVQERIELYYEQDQQFRDMLMQYTTVHENVIVTDLRGVAPIYVGNRFLIYSLYPKQNISIWVVDGRGKWNCPIEAGHSILNRTSKTDVGRLMRTYGGNGRRVVGTCQVPYEDADRVLEELTSSMLADG